MKRNSLRMRARTSPRTCFQRMRRNWKISFIQVGGQPVYLVRSKIAGKLSWQWWFDFLKSKAKWEVRKMNMSSHTCKSKPSSVTQRGKQLCGCLVPFARQFQRLKREFRRQNLAWTKHFPYTHSLMLGYSRVLNDRQMPSYTVCPSGCGNGIQAHKTGYCPGAEAPASLVRRQQHVCACGGVLRC